MHELTKETPSLPLLSMVERLVKTYLETMSKEKIINLRDLVLEQIEPPLLKAVMEKCHYNQSKAAKILGISRGTCRMMLTKYFGEHYVGHREKKDTDE